MKRLVFRGLGFWFARAMWNMSRVLWHANVKGIENIPQSGPVLFVSNHPSYIEPFLLTTIAVNLKKRGLAFMAWDKLFRIPVIGAILELYGAFPVDLKNPGRKPYETLLRELRAGNMAGIFPEGGRSFGDLMGEWKPGALRAAMSTDPIIVPVSIIGAQDAWPRDSMFPRLLRRITVVFHRGRKLETMGEFREDTTTAKDWLKTVENILRAEINAPLYDDARARAEKRIKNYKAATPARLSWRGEILLNQYNTQHAPQVIEAKDA